MLVPITIRAAAPIQYRLPSKTDIERLIAHCQYFGFPIRANFAQRVSLLVTGWVAVVDPDEMWAASGLRRLAWRAGASGHHPSFCLWQC
jgi:hypothetical protein